MVYSVKNASFLRAKQQFFARSASNFLSDVTTESKFRDIDTRVATIGYSFLLQNQSTLETEFAEMFASLQKQDNENKEHFWFYCYYCASLLESFYKAYDQESNVKKYQEIKDQIKDRLKKKTHSENESNFIESLYQSFNSSIQNLVNSRSHISKIRDYVAYSNLCRLYWVFCRLTMTQGLTVAKDLQLIEKLDMILGTHTDVDKIISFIQAPNYVLNYFSVGFFLARFMIDGGLLIKHTFFPAEHEKGEENSCEIHLMDKLPGALSLDKYRNSYILIKGDVYKGCQFFYVPKNGLPQSQKMRDSDKLEEDLIELLGDEKSTRLEPKAIKNFITAQTDHVPEPVTRFDRFKHELYKRHCNFANDFVWATVNFLTNFNNITGIPGPIAGYLTSVFLVFDVAMILYKRSLAKEEYLIKRSQYLQEIQEYSVPGRFNFLSSTAKATHIEVLFQQLTEHDLSWQAKEAAYYFNAAAAALLLTGFTAFLIIGSPLIVVGCYFTGNYCYRDVPFWGILCAVQTKSSALGTMLN